MAELLEPEVERSSSTVGRQQQLLRTVSQKMKSFLAGINSNSNGTGSCGSNLYFPDHLGSDCRCKVTPREEDSSRQLIRSNSSSSSSSSKVRWLSRFSVGRGKLQGMPSDSESLSGGCFGFDSSRRRSISCFCSRSTSEQRYHEEEARDTEVVLPDDLLEMCLVRLPFDSLVRARAVCRRWKSLILSSHFLQLREEHLHKGSHQPWLFLLGLSRQGVCAGQIQALDPANDKWHTIRAQILSGRLLYSAASFGSRIFVVGGCSARVSGEKGGVLKTHTSVLVLDAVTGVWKHLANMKSPRTTPVVVAFEMTQRLTVFNNKDGAGTGPTTTTTTTTGETGVYRPGFSSSKHYRLLEIMGRRRMQQQKTTTNRELWEAYKELQSTEMNLPKNAARTSNRYGLIVVGGQGELNETVYGGEVYDSESDTWREMSTWPAEAGSICSGVVLDQVLYAYSDTDKLLAYDLARDTWRVVAMTGILPGRLGEYVPRLVACGGGVGLVGVVWDGGKAGRKVWRMERVGGGEGKWGLVSVHPDAPLDWNAVFVGHRNRVYGVEMFRIFGQVLDFVTVMDGGKWDRVSKRRMAVELDASCCITKTAVVVQL